MIVITIIAIIMTIVLPNMVRSRHNAILVSCQANERSLAGGMESYTAQFGRYPSQLSLLYPDFTKRSWCPTNRSDYTLSVDTEGKHYTLSCNGIHHLSVPRVAQGYPQYSPNGGALEKPATH